jgi:hypothetical protein
MPVYQVVGKTHVRATFRVQEAVDVHGNTFTVTHAGDPVRLAVGTLLDDVTSGELAAFPDRFQLVSGEDSVVSPPASTLNPELLALVQRAYKGQATINEQELVEPVLAFLVAHAAGADTAEQRNELTVLLEDWGMPLFI